MRVEVVDVVVGHRLDHRAVVVEDLALAPTVREADPDDVVAVDRGRLVVVVVARELLDARAVREVDLEIAVQRVLVHPDRARAVHAELAPQRVRGRTLAERRLRGSVPVDDVLLVHPDRARAAGDVAHPDVAVVDIAKPELLGPVAVRADVDVVEEPDAVVHPADVRAGDGDVVRARERRDELLDRGVEVPGLQRARAAVGGPLPDRERAGELGIEVAEGVVGDVVGAVGRRPRRDLAVRVGFALPEDAVARDARLAVGHEVVAEPRLRHVGGRGAERSRREEHRARRECS